MMPIDCFLFGGVCAGLKQSKKLDLGLIFCSQPCVVGGIFTQNRYPSPHVLYGREILPSKNIQAILVNIPPTTQGCEQKMRPKSNFLLCFNPAQTPPNKKQSMGIICSNEKS